jgi:catechol 2,3-dioxygenase-like lactoylglutathione lyase family enzyme
MSFADGPAAGRRVGVPPCRQMAAACKLMADTAAPGRYCRAMLINAPLIGFVSVTDATRARHFYRDVLGLELVDESPFALEFDCAGTMLRVTLANHIEPAPYTVLGWRVEDVGAAVGALTAAGVSPQIFEGFGQTAEGIWLAPGGAKVAWFKDPDGNLLSVTEFPH